MSSARLSRTRLPFTTGLSTISFSYCLRLNIPISLLDLLYLGHCLSTTVLSASSRHELRSRYLVSFCDVRYLFLFHSVSDLNSLRDLLDGRHPFLHCWFIYLKCICVVSTAFWIFPGSQHLAMALSFSQLECSPLRRIARI